MRILSTVTQSYYGQPHAIEPMYLEFSEPLRRMGHWVDHFDHVRLCAEIGPEKCGEKFAEKVKRGCYDVVFYQTGGRDFMVRQAISDAAWYAPIVAWNSDDDWQWESYTSQIAPLFTYMITTYPHVYDQGRVQYPNLLLSQWGCLDTYAEPGREKDLPFTFVGQIYRTRVAEMRYLRKKAGLKVRGLGALRVSCPPFENRRFREAMARWFPSTNRALAFQEVHSLWNRSKISYTPLGASKDRSMLQIKGRVFQMGLSGTLMLVQRSPELERYYEPGKEYVPFDDLDDCVSKAAYYLQHESERRQIASAYHERTTAEHLWSHRFEKIFDEIGLARAAVRSRVA